MIYTVIEFAKKYRGAFEDLPEAFQTDNRLQFQDDGENLICYPMPDKVKEMGGRWVASYDKKRIPAYRWSVIYPIRKF